MSDTVNSVDFSEIKKNIRSFYTENPYVQLLNMKLEDMQQGEVTLILDVQKEHTNFYHIAHGGILMSVADTAMGAACLSFNKRVVTLNFNMNFLKYVPLGGRLTVVGKVIHNGSRTLACEAELLNDEGKLLGKASATMFVMGAFVTSEVKE